jgi:3-methylfumaryl-CoA hydratase
MTVIDSTAVGRWRGHIGRTEIRRQRLDAAGLVKFARAIGEDGNAHQAPPPLAAWAWFHDSPVNADLDEDGHAKRGGLIPEICLPRRMFAGTQWTFVAPLLIDEWGELELRVNDVAGKQGRKGALVFVEILRTLRQRGRPRSIERQTLVYRKKDVALQMPAPVAPPEAAMVWRPDEVELFRFSAATSNAHRIHYDRDYARGHEGYPDLVVQGPLVASKLARLAARQGVLASFDARFEAPTFVNQPVSLIALEAGQYAAIRCDGTIAVRARATFR